MSVCRVSPRAARRRRAILPVAAVFALASAIAPAWPADAQDAASAGRAALVVVVEGVKAAEGAMMVALYRDAEAWDANAMAHGEIAAVTTPTTEVAFAGLAPGDYAVKLYHDEDGDGQLDTGLFGVPSEPYGFSNNARGRYGPASYEDAVFSLAAGETRHAITLID